MYNVLIFLKINSTKNESFSWKQREKRISWNYDRILNVLYSETNAQR